MDRLQPMHKIAFDIGGTFTDFVLEDGASGERRFLKVLSNHVDPGEAVVEGVNALLAKARAKASQIDTVLHATTVATNAIIERKGSHTALVTTEGFRDVLLIGRQKRYEMFDMHLDKPQPLITRADIFEVRERVLADGAIEKRADVAQIDRVLEQIRRRGYRSVAVCLLHSYIEPAHERLISDRIKALGINISVTLSSDISPKLREYERTSTTVADAYVKPIVTRYVNDLSAALKAQGVEAELFIIQSSGGLVTPELATSKPIQIVESGPAAGVLMCASVGQAEGLDHVLSFDMGGTTAKLGAIDGGVPAVLPSFEVDQLKYKPGSGLPLNISAIELLEIGAGGGSIAHLDMGILKIGPESAGSNPGPVCYGNGGKRPTVTDANLVLGYLNPDYFNAGAMQLDVAGARAAIEREVAKPLHISLDQAAWGIHALANANMERAMRIMSVERGRDPREYVLVAFGGAGPLHAVQLAIALGIPRVIVPVGAGVGSAVGLLEADPRLDYSITHLLKLSEAKSTAIEMIRKRLFERARGDIARMNRGDPSLTMQAYCRYGGQGHEIRVDVPDNVASDSVSQIIQERFAQAYRRTYGYDEGTTNIEAVEWHLAATYRRPAKEAISHSGYHNGHSPNLPLRPVYFVEKGGVIDCPVYSRRAIAPGSVIAGPAIIEEPESTTVVPPNCTATVSALGNLMVDIATERRDG